MEPAALYLRLSQEDGERWGESQSISNQRTFLSQYCRQNGFTVSACYIDDGYTGTNFNRPGFQKLIQDIEQGKVKTVITKDLSRLGRDYIETGRYVDCFFPEKGVRYIAVNDGVDTGSEESAGNDMSAFKTVFNDFYAKDVSKKVRSALTAKRRAGQFIGAWAPYGYQKDPSCPGRLQPDPDSAPVVQRIYRDFLKGKSIRSIAGSLTQEGIPTPLEKRGSLKGTGRWNESTIRRILTCETYVGNLTQNQSKTVSYKVKKRVSVPKEEWIVVPNTHEPLISKEEFQMAQQIFSTRPSAQEPKEQHLLSGLVFCGGCGSPMTFVKDGPRTYLVCSSSRRYPGSCKTHCIREDQVEQTLLDSLRELCKNIPPQSLYPEFPKKSRELAARELRSAKEQLDFYQRTSREAENFPNIRRQFLGYCEAWQRKVDALEEELTAENPEDRRKLAARELLGFEQPERPAIQALVKKIVVHGDKSLDLHFLFPDPREGFLADK